MWSHHTRQTYGVLPVILTFRYQVLSTRFWVLVLEVVLESVSSTSTCVLPVIPPMHLANADGAGWLQQEGSEGNWEGDRRLSIIETTLSISVMITAINNWNDSIRMITAGGIRRQLRRGPTTSINTRRRREGTKETIQSRDRKETAMIRMMIGL